MIAAGEKYTDYSEKGSEKFSHQNFLGIQNRCPTMGIWRLFDMTEKSSAGTSR